MAATLKPPARGVAYWTAWTDVESSAEPMDPLRFDMYAQRIGNVLLPGVTNRVERLRYFGMVCAGIHLTRPPIARVTDPRIVREWRRSVLPFEAGWALATVIAAGGAIKDLPPAVERPRLKWEYQGLRGANHALDYYRRSALQSHVKPNNYMLLKAQEAQGGLGSYLVALREYGFVDPDRFGLTPVGEDLARRFLSGTRRPEHLLDAAPVSRPVLARLGEKLSLTRNVAAEAELVQAGLFSGDHPTAIVIRRIPKRLRRPDRSAEAMAAIADPSGDPLHRAAQFAVDFDPFRRLALSVFSQVGRRLMGHAGPARIAQLIDDPLDDTCVHLRAAAGAVANAAAPTGLEPIAGLAQRISAAESSADVILGIVRFHRQEGRRWVEPVGGERVAISTPGRFDPPRESFHGYTLPSALRVYRDVIEAV